MKYVLSLSCIVALLLILTGCDVNSSTGSSSKNGNYFSKNVSLSSGHKLSYRSVKHTKMSTSFPDLGQQTKTSGCQVQGSLQDHACTPGAVFPDVTAAQVCQADYTSSVRKVPTGVENQVYAEYGIQNYTVGQYEVDHVVSVELGGSNDIANLWPEAASPKPGFHEKDQVEKYLHDQVCLHNMPLYDAQIELANNWLDVYIQMSLSSM